MKKQFGLLLLILALLLSGLVSCKIRKDDGTQNVTDPPRDTETAEGVIYSPDKEAVIVFDAGGVTEENLALLKGHLTEKTGGFVLQKDSSATATGGEIILGRTSRPLSEKAYKQLERIETRDDTEVRYVIYSDGSSVAIAYDGEFYGINAAEDEAIAYFIENYCAGGSLRMEPGIYAKESFSVTERQNEKDRAVTEAAWDNAYSELAELYGKAFADETLKAFKKHYSLYTDGAVDWLADLFDPVAGGFYYSNSARDTVGYLPDLESTGQALSFLASTGVFDSFGGDVKSGVPEWFGERIVAYVKGLQDPNNGYFYHPQWTRAQSDANSARLGRDLTNAVNILNRFDAIPTYDTPTGVKGEYRLGTLSTPTSSITERLSAGCVSAVSKLLSVNADDSAVAAHLRSEQAFRNYLASLNDDIIVNDYKVGNLLESQANQIVTRDVVLRERGESYRLSDILEEWLTSKQDPQTGLWAKGDKNDYDAVNGLLKISSTYSRIGKRVPNAERGLRSAISALTSETEIRHVCDILNPWYAIRILSDNIASYSEDVAALDAIRTELISNYPAAVTATTEKLALLLRPDGSFGYLRESSSATSQEMPVAVPDTYEGDVNASYIAVSSIPDHMFAVLGISFVAPYTEADRIRLYRTLEKMGAIIKDDVIPAEPVNFENDRVGEVSSSVSAKINSSGSIEVAADPYAPSNRVLLIDSYEDGAGVGSDDAVFELSSKSIAGGCFVFECDMMVSGESREGNFAQINMGPELFMLNVGKKEGKVYFAESSSTNGTYAVVYDVGAVANADEWFNVRIEYYPGEEDTVRIKLYVDGVLLAVSDNYYDHRGGKLAGEGIPGTKYLSAKFVVFSNCRGKIYVDNVVLDKTVEIYAPLLAPEVQPVLRNVDSPDVGAVIYGFEDGKFDGSVTVSGGAKTEETAIGNAMVLSAVGDSVMIDANARGMGANAALFESRIYVPDSTPVGAKLAVNFCNFGDGSEVLMGIHLVVSENADGKYLAVAEGIGSSTGDVLGESRIPIGEAFILRIEFFFKKTITAIYADGDLVGTTLTGANGSNMKYYSKTRIFVPSAGEFILDDVRVERVKLDEFSEKDSVVHGFDKGFGDASASPSVIIKDGAASFAEAGAGSMLTVPVNKRSDVPSTYTAEFKLNIGESFLYGGELGIRLLDAEGGVIAAYDIVGEEAALGIFEVTENGRYQTALAYVEELATFTVRYSKKLGVAILYADGKCIATSNIGSFGLDYRFAGVEALGDVNDFALVSCVAEISMQEFEVEIPESDGMQGGSFGFETGSSVDLPSFIKKTFASNTARLAVKEVIRAGERSKALEFITGDGGKDVVSFAYTDYSILSPGTVVFETDIMMNTKVANSSFEIEPVHGDTRAYKLTVSVRDGGNITVSGADISSTVIARDGEWFRLRIEYTNPGKDLNGDGKNDIQISVYVNGEETPRAVGYTPYTSTAYKADEISAFRFFTWTSADMEIVLDNTFVGGIDNGEEPEDGDTEGGEDNNESGGSGDGTDGETDFGDRELGDGDVITGGGTDYDGGAWAENLNR